MVILLFFLFLFPRLVVGWLPGEGLLCSSSKRSLSFSVPCGFCKVVPQHEEGIASRAEARTHVGTWPQPAPASL